ncbi:hypothetical protein ES705_48996 [subsurface metagenome]
MQVRVLPIAQQKKGTWVEKCESHKVVKGLVERSAKEDGMVVRKRRCDVCGDLIKTIEMTEDQQAHIRVEFENQNRVLRTEIVHYKAVESAMKGMFQSIERLGMEMMVAHEIAGEDKF